MGKRVLNPLSSLARSVLDRGGEVVSVSEIAWKVSGNCTDPVTVTRTGRPYVDLRSHDVYDSDGYWRGHELASPPSGKITVEITARCRKCESCLRVRANHWAARARIEVARAPRTWFGTLTLSPEKAYHYRALAAGRWRANGDLFEEKPDVIFAKWHLAIASEITLMFKRLRKSGFQFRYMLVVEAHKSGTPHYHVLLHEQSAEVPVRHAVLTAAWPLGFTNWKLVDDTDPKVVWYAVKYLGKSKLARVRASLGYGDEIVPDDFITTRPSVVMRNPKGEQANTTCPSNSSTGAKAPAEGGQGEGVSSPPNWRATALDEEIPF